MSFKFVTKPTFRFFMFSRDQVSEFCKKCNSIHALLWFSSTPGSCGFCLLTDFTIGIFRTMSEHIVVSSWLGTDDTFLTLGIFFQRIFPASVTTEGSSSSRDVSSITRSSRSPSAVEVEVDASCSSNPFVDGFLTDPTWCPPLLVLAQSFRWVSTIQWMVRLPFLVTAITGTMLSMLHSITFLPFDNLGVSSDGHE